jgi:ElaB/YqjD/DUF883 family membrane-anchored ribosome-binding protein
MPINTLLFTKPKYTIMAFLKSLKKLFGTSREVAEVKGAELKEQSIETAETAREMAKEAKEKVEEVFENVKEKTEATLEKLDEKAAAAVDKLEVKLRSTIEKPVIEEPLTEVVGEPEGGTELADEEPTEDQTEKPVI